MWASHSTLALGSTIFLKSLIVDLGYVFKDQLLEVFELVL